MGSDSLFKSFQGSITRGGGGGGLRKRTYKETFRGRGRTFYTCKLSATFVLS